MRVSKRPRILRALAQVEEEGTARSAKAAAGKRVNKADRIARHPAFYLTLFMVVSVWVMLAGNVPGPAFFLAASRFAQE